MRAALARIVVPALVVAACSSSYGSSSPSSSGGTDGGSTSNGSSGTPVPPSSSGGASSSSGDASTSPLPPGVVQCALTSTNCDTNQGAECCVTVIGSDNGVVRDLSSVAGKCQANGGPNCGSYTSVGPDFTMKFPQTCAGTADCAPGQVCCVSSIDPNNPLAKEIGGIACQASCPGRTLCIPGKSGECSATQNCLPETDPVLSKIYANYCR